MELETDKSLALLVSEAGVVHNTLVLASKVYSEKSYCPVYGVDVLKLTVGVVHRWFGDFRLAGEARLTYERGIDLLQNNHLVLSHVEVITP